MKIQTNRMKFILKITFQYKRTFGQQKIIIKKRQGEKEHTQHFNFQIVLEKKTEKDIRLKIMTSFNVCFKIRLVVSF